MTKKDYKLMADAISHYQIQFINPTIDALISRLCYVLGQDNHRFNPDKFREACNPDSK